MIAILKSSRQCDGMNVAEIGEELTIEQKELINLEDDDYDCEAMAEIKQSKEVKRETKDESIFRTPKSIMRKVAILSHKLIFSTLWAP